MSSRTDLVSDLITASNTRTIQELHQLIREVTGLFEYDDQDDQGGHRGTSRGCAIDDVLGLIGARAHALLMDNMRLTGK